MNKYFTKQQNFQYKLSDHSIHFLHLMYVDKVNRVILAKQLLKFAKVNSFKELRQIYPILHDLNITSKDDLKSAFKYIDFITKDQQYFDDLKKN